MENSLSIEFILEKSSFFSVIDAVYLFGSRATGKNTLGSDYDIAILFAPKHAPTFEEQLELKGLLEDFVKADVDLLVLNSANLIISMQAVSKGKLIYDKNPFRRGLFVANLYSQYAEFKEMRAPMEKNILKRKFYGR